MIGLSPVLNKWKVMTIIVRPDFRKKTSKLYTYVKMFTNGTA